MNFLGSQLPFDALTAVLVIPAAAAVAARSAARLLAERPPQRAGVAGDVARCADPASSSARRHRPISSSTTSTSSSSCSPPSSASPPAPSRASYIGHELEIGRLTPRYLRFYHAMYQTLMFAMNLGAHRQQHRPDVGRHRDRHAHHRADGGHLPHARGAGGGVEVFHPRQRRHCARAVRHHSRLHGGAAGARRGPGRHGVDGADRQGRRLRARAPQRRLRVPDAGLRHQGGAGAAARLASRCPRRGPDAHLRRALGPAPQRRALRAAALQDAARRQSRRPSRPGR